MSDETRNEQAQPAPTEAAAQPQGDGGAPRTGGYAPRPYSGPREGGYNSAPREGGGGGGYQGGGGGYQGGGGGGGYQGGGGGGGGGYGGNREGGSGGGSGPRYGGPRSSSGGEGGRPRRPGGRGYMPKRKVDQFAADHVKYIDYKDISRLRRYLSERAKIEPRRKTGTLAKNQRALAVALKRARHMALLPFVGPHSR